MHAVKCAAMLHDVFATDTCGKAEEDKQDEMGPGPGDLQIFRIGADGRKEWSFLLGEG